MLQQQSLISSMRFGLHIELPFARSLAVCALIILILSGVCEIQARGLDSKIQTPKIERVSFTRRLDGQGYVVRLHSTAFISAHSMPTVLDGGTVSVTLFGAKLDQDHTLDSPAGPVSSYRIDEIGRDVVLQMEMTVSGVEVTAYRDRRSNDILVGISVPVAAGNPPEISPAATSAERWTLDTIVIDAGHGGKDFGATARGGVREKDIVLAVARSLGSYLEELLGINVVYTRDSDKFVSLESRGHFANKVGGKLFVSLHANSAPDRQARGTETFFLGMHKSDAAKQVMDRENEVIRFEADQSGYEQFDAQFAVMQSLAQSAFMRQSQILADLVEKQFQERVGRKSRGIKQAGFYVLYGASMPSILIELGFVSNPEEAAFMTSNIGQVYLASAIFRAIRSYKSEYEKGLHLTGTNRK